MSHQDLDPLLGIPSGHLIGFGDALGDLVNVGLDV